MANTSIYAAFERMWQHIIALVGGKADVIHNHDDLYYTETEVNTKLEETSTSIVNMINDLSSEVAYIDATDNENVEEIEGELISNEELNSLLTLLED